MHDHLGGGFHRYSVDRYWHVPHFEKMLYDQAQIASAYLDAFQITKRSTICRRRSRYFGLRRARHDLKGRGFFSAKMRTAFSSTGAEHGEGAFYVGPRTDRRRARDDSSVFKFHYGVQRTQRRKAAIRRTNFAGSNILISATRLQRPRSILKRAKTKRDSRLPAVARKLVSIRTGGRVRISMTNHRGMKALMISAYARRRKFWMSRVILRVRPSNKIPALKSLRRKKANCFSNYRESRSQYRSFADDLRLRYSRSSRSFMKHRSRSSGSSLRSSCSKRQTGCFSMKSWGYFLPVAKQERRPAHEG